jgi:hypothetical protein
MIPRDTTTSAAQHRSSSSLHFGVMTTSTAPTQDHPCDDHFNAYVEPKRHTLSHDGSFDYQNQKHGAHQGRNNHRNEYQQVNRGQEDQRDPYNSTNTMRRCRSHHHVAIPEDEGKYNDNTREQQRRQQHKTILDKFQPYLHLFGVTMIVMFAYYVWTVAIPYIFQVVFPMVFNLLCILFACSIVVCIGWLLYSRTATASATTSATKTVDNGRTSAVVSPVVSPPSAAASATTSATKTVDNGRTSAVASPVVSPPTKNTKSERRATRSKRKHREAARENARRKMDALREVQKRKSKDSRGEQRPIPPDVSGLTRPEIKRVYQEYWSDNMEHLGNKSK